MFDGKKIKTLAVPMTEEMHDTVHQLAEIDGHGSAPELIRYLLENYIQARAEAYERYDAIFAKGVQGLKKSRQQRTNNSGSGNSE